VAAGVVAAAGTPAMAAMALTETDVEVKTADGVCDAAFIRPHPRARRCPHLTDAFGLPVPFVKWQSALQAKATPYWCLTPITAAARHLKAKVGLHRRHDRAKLMELMGSLTTDRVNG